MTLLALLTGLLIGAEIGYLFSEGRNRKTIAELKTRLFIKGPKQTSQPYGN
jgi:hypothetical protein